MGTFVESTSAASGAHTALWVSYASMMEDLRDHWYWVTAAVKTQNDGSILRLTRGTSLLCT